jgi:SAM-dependent methyltransferase
MKASFRRTHAIYRLPDDGPGYEFVWRSPSTTSVLHSEECAATSRAILDPSRTDPNFLVLRERREILASWISSLPTGLCVLDVGGRLQPYRPLLETRTSLYVGLDPILEGSLAVAAVGESLPFRDESFDLVICTQTLNYVENPFAVVGEIYRVLKSGGSLYLTVPAIFPRYHDQRWRFMPAGIASLLADFSDVEIVPEGRSLAGLCRTLNLFLDTFLQGRLTRRAARLLFATLNIAGGLLDRASGERTRFATNYACRARKGSLDDSRTQAESPAA